MKSFSEIEYAGRRKTTRRDEFLSGMDKVIPWDKWVKIIQPFYYSTPKGKRGRKPMGIETMLRMYLLQIWFSLSDEAVEDSIYDSYAMRTFMKTTFTGAKQVPDAATLLKFRHIIEKHNLGEKIFEDIREQLEKDGRIMHGGTIVDATIVNAPSSTKNEKNERDPEMHSTKKGDQYFFGMKIHIGTCAGTGYVHSLTAAAANVHDIAEAANLIRKDDRVVYGDSGYLGIEKREDIKALDQDIEYRINSRRGKVRTLPDGYGKQIEAQRERRKSSVRSKAEHAFHIVKNIFGFRKVSYRGLAKNLNRAYMSFGSANMLMYAGAIRAV